MESHMDMLSLVEAARKIGITTLAKAIKSGRLSVSRKEDGSYEIDPAELARVYSFSAPGETATANVPFRAGARGQGRKGTVQSRGEGLAGPALTARGNQTTRAIFNDLLKLGEGCACRKSDSAILVMKAAEDRL